MRRLSSGDKETLLHFLYRNYANNLFFFSYLEALDNVDSAAAIYGVWDDAGLIFAGLVSPIHACVSTQNKRLLPLFSPLVMEAAPARILGPEEPTVELISYCAGYVPHPYTFARLEPDLLPKTELGPETTRAGSEDIPELVDFYAQSGFFQNPETRLPRMVRSGTVYLTRKEGKVVAATLTHIETPDLAMIGGVYTDPAYRRRGLARATVLALCRELTRRRLGVYLYYDCHDPKARSLYRQLGFHDVGKWVIATKDAP